MPNWAKIEAEYLEGESTSVLAERHKVNINTLESRITNHKWKRKLAEISGKVLDEVQEKIKGITDTAINVLDGILKDGEAKHPDKIAAARAILDISGLKSSKVDNSVGFKPLSEEAARQVAKDIFGISN